MLFLINVYELSKYCTIKDINLIYGQFNQIGIQTYDIIFLYIEAGEYQ